LSSDLLKTSSRSLKSHCSEQCYLLSIVGGPFLKFTTFRTWKWRE
jgi:hypothetical protein